MRLIARSAAALLATGLVIGGTTTAAQAQSQTIKDKKADVLEYVANPNGKRLSASQSVKSGADIRSMKVDHSKKTVTVDLKFARLHKDTDIFVSFRTTSKAEPTHTLANISKKKAVVLNLQGEKECSAKLKTKLGKKGYIKATVKRSCLDNPKKVRVSAISVRYVEPTSAGGNAQQFVDVFSKSSVRKPAYTKALKRG